MAALTLLPVLLARPLAGAGHYLADAAARHTPRHHVSAAALMAAAQLEALASTPNVSSNYSTLTDGGGAAPAALPLPNTSVSVELPLLLPSPSPSPSPATQQEEGTARAAKSRGAAGAWGLFSWLFSQEAAAAEPAFPLHRNASMSVELLRTASASPAPTAWRHQPITLLQMGGSSALLPTPTPFDILTAQPVPPRGGWGTWPPEPSTPLAWPEPPPAPVPLFSLRLVELAAWSSDTLRVAPCADVHEGMVLAVGMGGPSEEYVRAAGANCTQLQRLDGHAEAALEVRLHAPLKFEHGDGELAEAMPALFQIPTHRLHARWEPPPPPEYLRALALANRAAEWLASHASRSPARWAPRDVALALALALLGLSSALLLCSCLLLGARRLARAWTALRLAEKQAGHLHASLNK